jgi:hypothetical protein
LANPELLDVAPENLTEDPDIDPKPKKKKEKKSKKAEVPQEKADETSES